ncbi:MAG: hypothetical protein ACI8S6_002040 [Myxococcota bacterium]
MSDLAVLVVSRDRPDLVQDTVDNLAASVTVPYDLHVIECGTAPEKASPHSTLWYADSDFRGKAFGHNIALQAARLKKRYRYYWVLMNDVRFDPAQQPAETLIATMEANPRMAILSPTEPGQRYPGGDPRPGGGWRPIATCDYLGFMMRGDAIEQVGFLDPGFTYCWGAIHELSFKLYSAGWFLAYSDDVSYRHLGGSTYGKDTRTISREEYQQRARRFALTHMVERYGWDWAQRFWEAATAQHSIADNTFELHRRMWAEAFSRSELEALSAEAGAFFSAPVQTQTQPVIAPTVHAGLLTQPNATRRPHADGSTSGGGAPSVSITDRDQGCRIITSLQAKGEPVRLHLGAGPEKREGWINVDINAGYDPEIVSQADKLPMLPDGCVDELEANHLFEHLHHSQAIAALKEWRRVLRPGGRISLELPNLAACFDIMGKASDRQGFDIGTIGIFGWPPAIDQEGVPQIHKWGWTPQTLQQALEQTGFTHVAEQPITQTWREAARLGRDMRITAEATSTTAIKSIPTPTPTPTPVPVPVPVVAREGWSVEGRATVNILLWPDFTRADDFGVINEVIAPRFAGLDAALLLRVDPRLDGGLVAAKAAVKAHGLCPAKIGWVVGDIPDHERAALGATIDGLFALPSSADDARATFLAHLGAPLLQLLPSQEDAPAPDPALAARIAALDPWFYPVEIGGVSVRPGGGSEWSAEKLSNRIRCRETLIVSAVAQRYDFRGKQILELASNCGYWSSQYVKRGASRVVGLEGRPRYVEQAKLYWETEEILPRGDYAFLEGNVLSAESWTEIRRRGSYDVTLCAGLLYHLPEYRQLLAWMASVTRDVMIIDTRVGTGPEVLVREPGDLHFNAIEETLDKITPNFQQLMAHIDQLGFTPERLVPQFESPEGLQDVDDYNLCNRVTIFARRKG